MKCIYSDVGGNYFWTMKNLLKYLFIDRQFEFSGQRTDFIESISKVKGVNIKKFNDNNLKIYPWISIGTLVSKSGRSWMDGINVKAQLADNDKPSTRIRLLTTVRPEHLFIAAIFLLFILTGPVDKEHFYKLIGDWVLGHVCFQIGCRIQEELLIKKIATRLRLVRM